MSPSSDGPRIVVPLDESPLAERALDLATAIARACKGTLVLLSVPRVYGTDLSWYYTDYVGQGAGATDFVPLEELMAESRDEARDYLNRVASRLTSEGLSVEQRVAEDIPARAVVATADEVDAALVVMSTHGRGGLTRWALGSVADKVLRTSTRPILLVRAGAEGPPESINDILVGLDGSALSEKVLPVVRWLSKAMEARVTLATVAVVPDVLPASRRGAREVTEMERAYEAQLVSYLEKHVAGLREVGIDATAEVITADDVAEALLDRDERGDVDVVALTTHGRGGLSRWAFGSVADRVVRAAATPVLVLRAQEQDAQEQE